uniref:Uncharacterized protein n=1 Tax=Globodera rostochiensis TaxID=31243 RepID=A0A914H0T8_GLORO
MQSRWQVKHRTEKVAKDKFGDQISSEQSVKYGDLKPDQIADKVIEAMGVAAKQLIQTMGGNNMEKPMMMILFGDKPTPTQLAQTQLAPRRSWPQDAVGPDAVGQTQLARRS